MSSTEIAGKDTKKVKTVIHLTQKWQLFVPINTKMAVANHNKHKNGNCLSQLPKKRQLFVIINTKIAVVV